MASFVELRGSQRIFSVGLLKDSALVMLEFEDHWGLEIRNVAGGGARSLPIEGIANLAPKWSHKDAQLPMQIGRGDGAEHLQLAAIHL